MAKGFWGNGAGTSASTFKAYIEFRTTTQEESRAYVQYKFAIQVTEGNFLGSNISTSWGSTVTLNGTGWYGDTGWKNYGWVDYGKSASKSCNASYTSNSSGYQKSSCSASYSPDVPTWKPKAPTSVSVKRTGDTKNTVSWTRNQTAARPYSKQVIQRSVDNGAWTDLSTNLSATATSYNDTGVSANHRYKYRVKAHNSAGDSDWASSGWSYNTPSSPSACTNTRNSDTKNTVSWTLGSSDTGLYTGHQVERSVNGGSWTLIYTAAATVTSYEDKTTSANNYYAYRVRSCNTTGNSSYATSGTTYNTPAAPGEPQMARTSDTAVEGTFANNANTATGLDIQRSTDRSTWTSLTSVSGKATTFSDNPGGGTFYYRIRNTRGTMVSSWVESDGIVTICAPAAPTITAPASSAVIPKSQTSINVAWTHNAIDGSAQTAAQLRYSTDGGSTWTTVSLTTASSYALTNGFDVNDAVSVQVRTKGVHEDYSPWSATRSFYVYQAPTVTVEEPTSGYEVENMPIHVDISYSDPSGTLAYGRVAVCLNGVEVYWRDVSDNLEFDIDASEWIPANGLSYDIDVSVRSSSTLQASATRTFSVSFEEPSMALAVPVFDEETGYVEVLIRKIDDSMQEIERTALYRVCGGRTVLLADNLAVGDVFLDKYAPLNTPYSYMTVSSAASGAVHQAMFPGNVTSDKLFFYWGNDGIASGKYNPDDVFTVSPSYAAVEVAGGDYPIAVIGTRLSEQHSVAVTLKSREQAMAFYEMVKARVPVVYKTLYGDVMHAIVVPKFAPRLSLPEDRWEMTLEILRTAGEAL